MEQLNPPGLSAGLASALPSLPAIVLCLAGLAWVVHVQARACQAAGVPYWQPWRVWSLGIAGGLFVLLQVAIVGSALGWFR